jgi:AcrR family transcriptional regulator
MSRISLPITRQRLLEAAGEVFAERGFRAATVREICRRAEANVAAVNYHFRDKQTLYFAVLKYGSDEALRKYPPTLDLDSNATAEQRLRAFVRSSLFRVADQGRPAWHGRVMAHEMAEPTGALDGLVDQVYRPLLQQLEGIVRELGGNALDDETVRWCARSIHGQCLYYYFARRALERMAPIQRYEPGDIERLAEHVTRFSLAAIRQLAPEAKGLPR